MDEFVYAQAKISKQVACADELILLFTTLEQKLTAHTGDGAAFNSLQNAHIDFC
jgi:hypothetical protein